MPPRLPNVAAYSIAEIDSTDENEASQFELGVGRIVRPTIRRILGTAHQG